MKKIVGTASAATRAIWGDIESEDDYDSDIKSLTDQRFSIETTRSQEEEIDHNIPVHDTLVPVEVIENVPRDTIENNLVVSPESDKILATELLKEFISDNELPFITADSHNISNESDTIVTNQGSNQSKALEDDNTSVTPCNETCSSSTLIDEVDIPKTPLEIGCGEIHEKHPEVTINEQTALKLDTAAPIYENSDIYTVTREEKTGSPIISAISDSQGKEPEAFVTTQPVIIEVTETSESLARDLHECSKEINISNRPSDTEDKSDSCESPTNVETTPKDTEETFNTATNDIVNVSTEAFERELEEAREEENKTVPLISTEPCDVSGNDLINFENTQPISFSATEIAKIQPKESLENGLQVDNLSPDCKENPSKNNSSESGENEHSSASSTDDVTSEAEISQSEEPYGGEKHSSTSSTLVCGDNVTEDETVETRDSSFITIEPKNSEIKSIETNDVDDMSASQPCLDDLSGNESSIIKIRKFSEYKPASTDNKLLGELSGNGKNTGMRSIELQDNSSKPATSDVPQDLNISAEKSHDIRNDEIEELNNRSSIVLPSTSLNEINKEEEVIVASKISVGPDQIDQNEFVKEFSTWNEANIVLDTVTKSRNKLIKEEIPVISVDKPEQSPLQAKKIAPTTHSIPKTISAAFGNTLITLPIRSKVLYKKPSVRTLHSYSSTTISISQSIKDDISVAQGEPSPMESSIDLNNGDQYENQSTLFGSTEDKEKIKSDTLAENNETHTRSIWENHAADESKTPEEKGKENISLASKSDDSRLETSGREKQLQSQNGLRVKSFTNELDIKKRGTGKKADGMSEQRAFYRHSSFLSQKFPDIKPKIRKSSTRSEISTPDKVKMSLKEKLKLKISDKLHRNKD